MSSAIDAIYEVLWFDKLTVLDLEKMKTHIQSCTAHI